MLTGADGAGNPLGLVAGPPRTPLGVAVTMGMGTGWCLLVPAHTWQGWGVVSRGGTTCPSEHSPGTDMGVHHALGSRQSSTRGLRVGAELFFFFGMISRTHHLALNGTALILPPSTNPIVFLPSGNKTRAGSRHHARAGDFARGERTRFAPGSTAAMFWMKRFEPENFSEELEGLDTEDKLKLYKQKFGGMIRSAYVVYMFMMITCFAYATAIGDVVDAYPDDDAMAGFVLCKFSGCAAVCQCDGLAASGACQAAAALFLYHPGGVGAAAQPCASCRPTETSRWTSAGRTHHPTLLDVHAVCPFADTHAHAHRTHTHTHMLGTHAHRTRNTCTHQGCLCSSRCYCSLSTSAPW